MIDIVDEKEIRNKLSTKGCIWINHDYMRDGELARKEFFLKKQILDIAWDLMNI